MITHSWHTRREPLEIPSADDPEWLEKSRKLPVTARLTCLIRFLVLEAAKTEQRALSRKKDALEWAEKHVNIA